MEEPKRVVLVEPGDVLLIGNAEIDAEAAAALGEWAEKIGIRVAVFPEAIDIDVLKASTDA